ncbi:hypothetical protein K438DRAFT_413267 [Mycena galopus ATCC 62051]|nr:hypothetical protein K438DRAFT_413267 [Mycena galopus ATCC 62051]
MSSARDIMLSAQEEAKGLIAELLVLEKAGINGDSIDWPAIDYGQVSTETCRSYSTSLKKRLKYAAQRNLSSKLPGRCRLHGSSMLFLSSANTSQRSESSWPRHWMSRSGGTWSP